ncbi:unnamed protein product [Adineta steineri]|uniref:Ig-like domain-containing protein n=1 Tax=Adineta steineri TaxID=433720 RepID=A0A815HWV1_9BILA|nr:unnamed protein product [Adineta steineri]
MFANKQSYKNGEYLRLPCSVEGKPVPIRRWFFNGKSIAQLPRIRFVYDGLYIEIEYLTLNDAGRYTCLAENSAGHAENHIDIDVSIPPVFNDSLSQVKIQALINSTVSLLCSAYGFPKPTYNWSLETNLLLNTTGDEELILENVQINDTGIYECIAMNRAGEIRKRFIVETYELPSIHLNNETNRIIIRRNESLSLECPASGYPIPITRWYKNEIELYEFNKEVYIASVDRQDAGLYSCIVSNSFGIDRRYFNIIISGPPEILRSHINTNPSVVRDSSITLSCPYTTERSSMITVTNTTWIPPVFQPEHELIRHSLKLNENQLTIPNVQIEDGQIWKCIVANEYGFDSLEFQLEVLVPPTILNGDTEELFQVESNNTVQLICQTYAHPLASIEWRKNGNSIDINQYLSIKNDSSEILQIAVKDEHDGGTFTCIASNSIGKSEKNFLVDVFLPPTFDYVSTNRHKIQLNRTYTLPCLVKGIPRPIIKWLKNEKIFPIDNERIELFRDGQYLEIRNINEYDAGMYTCLAENLAGKAKQILELQVLIPPRIENDTTNIEAIFNSTVNLTCSAYGNPKPTIVWFKEGRHLQYGNHYLSITLSSIKNNEQIIYTCIASNEAGNVEQHYRINRLVPPSIDSISITPTSTPIAGNHFTLECNAYGIPEPIISWEFNNHRLSSGHNRYYQVIHASLNNTGLYTCLAENKIAIVKKDIHIDVLLPPSILNNGQMINEITKLNGESLVLTCLLHAHPLPTIIWTKNDQILFDSERILIQDNNLKLYIENVSLIDHGRYQCQAENLAGRSQQIFDIQIYVPPEIHSSNINRNPYVILGKSIILSCYGFGVPQINYNWLKDEKSLLGSHSYARLLENGEKLQIDAAHLSDAGSYTCQMSNVAGQVNLTYQLDVFTPPTIDRSNLVEIYQVKSNQTARLECPMYGKPTPHIIWLINGRNLKINEDRYKLIDDTRILIINSVNQNDNARYTCIGTNIAGELSNHIELQIFVPPIIQREPNEDNVNVIQHHHIALTCTPQGDPLPSISWEKDGLPIDTFNSRYRIGPGSLQLLIIQADPSQAGIYTCLAYSKAGEAKQQFRLTVLIPPRIQRENTSYLVIAPKPIELPCQIIQGYPTPIVTWFHNNIELKTFENNIDLKYKISSSNSLLLLHTSKHDNGKYQCMIINEAGQDSIEVHLDINVPPIVTVESNEIIGIVNKPITLNCQADGHPLPVIYWTKASRSIDTQPGFQILNNGSLRIHHLQVQDTGYYLCWAENLVRRTYAQIRLEVQVPPSIDQIERHYTGIVDQSIKLSCQANGIPIPMISWYGIYNVSGTAIIDSFGNLYIDQLEKNHAGEIICSAENTVGKTSKQFTLIVLDHQLPPPTTTVLYETNSNQIPFLIISPKNLIIDYGDSLELICQTNLINPLDIQWLHNGHLINYIPYLAHFYDRNILRIDKAIDEHTGIYQCFSNNTFNQQIIKSLPVTVTVRPHPESHNRAITAGHRLILSCEIDRKINENFLGIIEWFHNGSPLNMNTVNRNRIDYQNGTLTIDQTSASDSGVYKCIFRSDNGTRSESYHSVNILTQPTFTIKLPRLTQRPVSGSMLILNCLADAWPEPILKWTKNGSTLMGIDGVRLQILPNNSLKIDPVQLSDTGRYTCSAENALGIATTTCDVIVYEIPLATSIRHLQGEIKRINIDNIILHINSILKKSKLFKISSKFLPIFQSNFLFLFPPSFFFLTTKQTNTNTTSPYCSMDDSFQRHIIISFTDGSYMTINERVSDRILEINGSSSDDYEFENNTFFTETIVQTGLGISFTLPLTLQNLIYTPTNSTRQPNFRPQNQSRSKQLSYLQIIEICTLCFILVEHTIILILSFQKKPTKNNPFDTNNQQQRQNQPPRSIVFSSKSILYNCLHRNWVRAYSFSNICLSLVYFIILILKHYYPNLLHYSSVTFYSLPLTLFQQLLINFSTFHLFIISISVLQHFIRVYRLLKTKYSMNIYSGKNLLITKHRNVALILSGSLALIFSYNYIFYTPRYPVTLTLLPLITLNMVLLPLIDIIIFIFILICCFINQRKLNNSIKHDLSFPDQFQQYLTNNLRLTAEKATCIKCYSKFLQHNRSLLKDTDPYTKLHSKFFSHNIITSARPSLALPDDKRKYSTASYENTAMMKDAQSHLRTSYSGQPGQIYLSDKSNRSQDFNNEQRTDEEQRLSTNDLMIQTTLLKLKRQRSICHLCYRLLLLFLFKYVLLTFPQHFIQMSFHLNQFYEYILKHNSYNNNNVNNNNNNILSEYNELTLLVCRFLFLFARFGDSLLLTRLPTIIKKYFPCWCQFNSKLLRKDTLFQRPSHQILMKNMDSPMNEPISGDDLSNINEIPPQQEQKQSTRTNRHRFRLHFQFVPLFSNRQQTLFKRDY